VVFFKNFTKVTWLDFALHLEKKKLGLKIVLTAVDNVVPLCLQ